MDKFVWVLDDIQILEKLEKQLPIDDAARRKLFQVRLDIFYDSSDALAEQVFTGDISIADWELSMRALVKEMHTSAAAIGKGGWDQMSFQEWGRLGTPVREQYKWLNKFAQDIADRVDDISLGTIRARARMYGRAAGYVAELMQASKEIISQLPWLPKDGSTECLTNCKCAWLLKIIKKTKVSQTVRAVWRMMEAEHCRDCPERNGHVEVFDVGAKIQVPSIIGGF